MKCSIDGETFRFDIDKKYTVNKYGKCGGYVRVTLGSQIYFLFPDRETAMAKHRGCSGYNDSVDSYKSYWAEYDGREREISFSFCSREQYNDNGSLKKMNSEYLTEVFGFVPTLAYRQF